MAVVLQLLAVLTAEFMLDYELDASLMFLVIATELLANIGWYFYYQRRQAGSLAILFQTLFDIVVLTLLLYLSGGATNAFVSILLVPIAFAAVCLPPLLMLFALIAAIGSY